MLLMVRPILRSPSGPSSARRAAAVNPRIPLREGPHKASSAHCPSVPFIQRSLASWVNSTVTTRHFPFFPNGFLPLICFLPLPKCLLFTSSHSPLPSRFFAAAVASCLLRQTPRSPMGCFLGCFGGAKERRRRRKRSPAQSPSGRARATPRLSPEKVALDGEVVSAAAPLLATLLELRDSTDDMCLTVVKKKVTFDPNVTTYEAAAIPEDDEEEADPAAGDEKDEARREKEWMLGPECAKSEAFPLNHRYGNCADSDNESEYDEEEDEEEDEDEDDDEEDGIDECAIDDEEDDGLLGIGRGEEEACESLFLLPMSKTKESSGQQEAVVGATVPDAATPCPTRDRSQYANPVFNSVENLTQWKEAKSRTTAPKASDKENIIMLGQENRMMDLLSEPAIPAKKKERPVVGSDYSPSTPSKQEVSVDASLSTWLGSSGTPESNSVRSYSPISREDRPILGALTVEDIKISSANSSPRRSRSPSPSPDDMPILGTVGAYWNCSAKGGDPVNRGGFMRTRSRFGQNFAG